MRISINFIDGAFINIPADSMEFREDGYLIARKGNDIVLVAQTGLIKEAHMSEKRGDEK